MANKNEKNKKKQREFERKKLNKKKQQTWWVMSSTLVVLILVVVVVGIVFQNKKMNTNGTSPSLQKQVIQYNNEPSMGSSKAPLKIAEFGDYKCKYCYQFEMNVFPQLKKDYIDKGKVQFFFMNYPIIAKDSILAANASETIYEEHPNDFWTFHKLLYENQGPETKTWVTQDLLVKIAKQAVPNLDEKPFRWSLDQSTYQDQVNRDKLMGDRLGVQGTPTLFINGVMAQNTLDYNGLKQEIDQALKKSQKSQG